MAKISDYKIVFNYALKELEEDVKRLIIKGWEPVGGITIATIDFKIGSGPEPVYAQAMVLMEGV
jgi:hypothetical protein